MYSEKRVKIVVPCHNEGPWLRITLDSVLRTTEYTNYEITVVANGDTRTDFAFLQGGDYDRVRLLEFEDALGVGQCINAAVELGDAEHYVFLDGHCLLEDRGWLTQAVACLEDHPNASMVQPEVLQFRCDNTRPTGGLAELDPQHFVEEGFAYSITWAWPYQYAENLAYVEAYAQQSTPYEAMAGGGMAVFVNAETFHRLGKYDPEVRGWYPETMDYAVHAWMLGHPMLVEPRVRVRHRVKGFTKELVTGHIHIVHGVLRTAYKYLIPWRRDLAEQLFRSHGLDAEVDEALRLIHAGSWLEERAAFLDRRVHDDDWLFAKFRVFEAHDGVR